MTGTLAQSSADAFDATSAYLLRGGVGDDFLFSFGGPDNIHGGRGNDTIIKRRPGGALFGGAGHDDLSGINSLHGGGGSTDAATQWGGPGNDVLNGTRASNDIHGGPGNDTIRGGGGVHGDTLQGGPGADSIEGNRYTDLLVGAEVPTY